MPACCGISMGWTAKPWYRGRLSIDNRRLSTLSTLEAARALSWQPVARPHVAHRKNWEGSIDVGQSELADARADNRHTGFWCGFRSLVAAVAAGPRHPERP